MKYAKGIMWLDDCRIPFFDEGDIKSQERAFTDGSSTHKGRMFHNEIFQGGTRGIANPTNTQGRFTPNLLVCDDLLNDGRVTLSDGGYGEKTLGTLDKSEIYNQGWGKNKNADGLGGYKDKGTNSRYYDLDKWFDKVIDEIR